MKVGSSVRNSEGGLEFSQEGRGGSYRIYLLCIWNLAWAVGPTVDLLDIVPTSYTEADTTVESRDRKVYQSQGLRAEV